MQLIQHLETMKLFRSILLNEGEEINTSNLGNSWTLCDIFAEDHADDINGFHGKDGYVILSIDVSENMIDFDNSLFSMEHRKNEFEIVVDSQDVESEVYLVQGIEFDENQIIKGNTGSNEFEDYTNEYKGDLTKKDLKDLINEFQD
jgi:hypothetical protein